MTPGRIESTAAGHKIHSRTDRHIVTGQDEARDNVHASHIDTPHNSQ